MKPNLSRREWMFSTAAAGAALTAGSAQGASGEAAADRAGPRPLPRPPAASKIKLGLISYNLGATWDLQTLLKVASAAGIAALEFRTTHAHKVEPDLGSEARAEVKNRCTDAGVLPWSLGTICEFHSPDAAVVKKNIDTCRDFIKLAVDIGAKGVKIRPNGLPKGVPVEKTLEQIGKSLTECGKAAADAGVEIFVEVHGPGTQEPPHIRTIMDHAAHPAVAVCWNSNPTDLKNGSISEYFDLLAKDIRHCHINELVSGYPYRELFGKFNSIGYDRYTMIEVGQAVAEAAGAKDPVQAIRFLKYYKALWTELTKG